MLTREDLPVNLSRCEEGVGLEFSKSEGKT